MVDNKLHLLLLLTIAMSKAQDEEAPCLMAKRYKPFNKYEYFYETESLNALNGAVNGAKASCKASQNIVNEISHNINKLIEDLKAQDAPEAMVYLKLLGAELGYLDTKDGKMIHNLLKMIPTDREFALTLSAGIEFVTEIGTHFPDYVHCGLEMHTNIYHESSVRAKPSVTDSQLKLSIPAPHGPTELISVT